MNSYLLLGTILSPDTPSHLSTYKAMLIRDGHIADVFSTIPSTDIVSSDIPRIDTGTALIIPGFSDIHLHAPQFANLGLGLDEELLPWLETYTFPEESKYKDISYATTMYTAFTKALLTNGITSSVIFASIHTPATLQLMTLLERAGLRAFVGKVNMDRNSPNYYQETTEESIAATTDWLTAARQFKQVRPILTPRFVPSCTPKLMQALARLADAYQVPVQSHLSENRDEIAWVRDLHPECHNYLDVYRHYGLLRGPRQTIMAHCVWCTEEEKQMLADYEVIVAHAPFSNADLASGIAPIADLQQRGIPIGLCSDISGGHELFMPRTIAMAAMMAKERATLCGGHTLTTMELFYMATHGGGIFPQIGHFAPDYAADFLIIDDSNLCLPNHSYTPFQRLQRFLYNGEPRQITDVYVAGKRCQR